MEKVFVKFGSVLAALALMVAAMNVNATCMHYAHQEEIPESAKKLSKIK